MRRIMISAALVLAAASLTFGQTGEQKASTGGNLEQELIKLDKDWTAAELRGDKDAVSKVVADDYQGTTADGKVENKAQYMEGIKVSTDKDMADDFNVRVFGDMAIMTHRGTVTTAKESFQYRSTHVWAKRDGRWQLIAHHGSNIQTPKPAQQSDQTKPAGETAKPQPEEKKP